MYKNIKHYSQKTSLVTTKLIKAILLGFLALNITGCLVEGDDASGEFNHVHNPKGIVSGLVQDTNGNVIEGATISIAGQEQKTDSSGRYTFFDVPVTNVEGNDNDGGPQMINIQIIPPENNSTNYLSATVSVLPAGAQIDGTENFDNFDDQVPDQPSTQSGNGVTTFVDGFVAEAPVVRLPELNNTVTGFLHDQTTGLPITNSIVHVNMTNTTIVGSNGNQGYVTLQDVSIPSTETNELGEFVIENVPNDTDLDLILEGYTFVSVSTNPGENGNFTTRIEDNVFLGNVHMESVNVGDDRAPFITNISMRPVINNTVATEPTEITRIIITISEPISVPFQPMAFLLLGNGNYIDMNMTVIQNVVTIDAFQDLSVLGNLQISFYRPDFSDAAGNSLDVSVNQEFGEFLLPGNEFEWLNLPVDPIRFQEEQTLN